jgi:hypothetical protein
VKHWHAHLRTEPLDTGERITPRNEYWVASVVLDYDPSNRSIQVEELSVSDEHLGNGYARELLNGLVSEYDAESVTLDRRAMDAIAND